MKMIRRFASWLFWETGIPLGPFAPYVLGLSIGRRPHRVYLPDCPHGKQRWKCWKCSPLTAEELRQDHVDEYPNQRSETLRGTKEGNE